MDVSIIIVNYNTRELTIQCLRSIYEQTTGLEFEVIVVDNASTDNSCTSIKTNFPNVFLIESDENLGFGKANNLGANIAKGKYLFFLNSDTILLNNSIYILFQFNEIYGNKLNIGVSGGILLDENRIETGSFGPLPTKMNTLKLILGFLPRFTKMTPIELTYFQTNEYLEVGYITGADMFISKFVFQNIGSFDPIFFMYYEETDLQLRLKNKNFRNYIVDKTQIVHLEGASLKQANYNNKKRLIVTKSMFYFFKKHSGPLSFYIFKFLFFSIRLSTLFHPNYLWSEKKDYILQIIKS